VTDSSLGKYCFFFFNAGASFTTDKHRQKGFSAALCYDILSSFGTASAPLKKDELKIRKLQQFLMD
jgi:hypothetical protein